MLSCAAGLTGISLLALGILVGFEINPARGTGGPSQPAVKAVAAVPPSLQVPVVSPAQQVPDVTATAAAPEKVTAPVESRVDSAPATEPHDNADRKSLVNVVDVGSFRDRAIAESLAKELEDRGYSVSIVGGEDPHKGGWMVVRVGPYGDRKEASEVAVKLTHFRGSAPVVRVVER